jgi:hypothetical protein
MQTQIPKTYTYPVHSASCESVSVAIFLSCISSIINRVKSREEAKQVQGTFLLSQFPDCLYKSPTCCHMITKQHL